MQMHEVDTLFCALTLPPIHSHTPFTAMDMPLRITAALPPELAPGATANMPEFKQTAEETCISTREYDNAVDEANCSFSI